MTRKTAALSEDGVYRYELTRFWGDPDAFIQRYLTFVMLNPSIADSELDDPTIRRCCGFARRLGFEGIRVVNLYAYRATDPDDLKAAATCGVDVIGPDNARALRVAMLRSYNSTLPIVCAWGLHADADRVAWFLTEASAIRARTAVLGLTQSGVPKHPLARGRSRIPDDAPLIPWPGVVPPRDWR